MKPALLETLLLTRLAPGSYNIVTIFDNWTLNEFSGYSSLLLFAMLVV
jgi:hypothetical protein